MRRGLRERVHEPGGVEDLALLGTQPVGGERGRLLQRDERQQLQQVVLDDVAGGTDPVVVAGAAAQPDVLGHGDLHVVDVVGVPDRFEELVREPHREDVLHRPLPRQGDGAEHPRAAVRQPAVRADLERHYVDHMQITIAEDIGLGGRAGYYDGIGAARDVIQNHLLQLLALAAMEEPISFAAAGCATEKSRCSSHPAAWTRSRDHRARPVHRRVRAAAGPSATCEEEDFARAPRPRPTPRSRCEVDNRRWAGVPFYLRTGKRMGRRVTEIAVVFKRAPHLPFSHNEPRNSAPTRWSSGCSRTRASRSGSVEGAGPADGGPRRDHGLLLRPVVHRGLPEAYERLILDVLLGEPSLFPRERGGRAVLGDPRPGRRALGRAAATPEQYAAGTWGPDSATQMLARTGREWRRP